MLPDRFEDRRHRAIEHGMQRLGYRLEHGNYSSVRPGSEHDVLLTWTIHKGAKHEAARRFEDAGARVVVAEEAYLKADVLGVKHFALSLHDHNGAGQVPDLGPERWQRWGVDLKPWRRDGEYVVVREQRGIGSPLMASPAGWHDAAIKTLKRVTERPLRLRRHCKLVKRGQVSDVSVDELLASAWCVVVWASSLGVRALYEGVPVIAAAPHWICKQAAGWRLRDVNDPPRPPRLPAFERLAWAQWSLDEIRSGEALDHLLRCRR